MPTVPESLRSDLQDLEALRAHYAEYVRQSGDQNQRWIEALSKTAHLKSRMEALEEVAEKISPTIDSLCRQVSKPQDQDKDAPNQGKPSSPIKAQIQALEQAMGRLRRLNMETIGSLNRSRSELKLAIEDYQAARHAEIIATDRMFQHEAFLKQEICAYLLQQKDDWKASFFAVEAERLCQMFADQCHQWHAHAELASLGVLQLPEKELKLTEKPSPEAFEDQLRIAIKKKRLPEGKTLVECRISEDSTQHDAILISLPIDGLSFPLRLIDHLYHLLECGRQRRTTTKVLTFSKSRGTSKSTRQSTRKSHQEPA
jgi:hypothetical protein